MLIITENVEFFRSKTLYKITHTFETDMFKNSEIFRFIFIFLFIRLTC